MLLGRTNLLTVPVYFWLADKLEEMPGVGRAFVHVDHEVSHRPEHRKYD